MSEHVHNREETLAETFYNRTRHHIHAIEIDSLGSSELIDQIIVHLTSSIKHGLTALQRAREIKTNEVRNSSQPEPPGHGCDSTKRT